MKNLDVLQLEPVHIHIRHCEEKLGKHDAVKMSFVIDYRRSNLLLMNCMTRVFSILREPLHSKVSTMRLLRGYGNA
jgi:hypothetical protein